MIDEQVRRYHAALAEHLSWWNFTLERLTPLHLLCACRGTAYQPLEEQLARQQFRLAVLFTANRTRRDGSGDVYHAGYVEQDRVAFVTLGALGDTPANRAAIEAFASWVYDGEGRTADRLIVLQKVFAQALRGPTAEANTVQLVETLSSLLKETQAQYGVFIRDQLDKYFQQRQAAADYVADVAKKVAELVDTLTKGASDTALTTIAAVVAVLIAALSNEKLRGDVFRFSLLAYCAYLVFQAAYRLLGARDSYGLLEREAQSRVEALATRLGRENLQPFLMTLTQRRHQFRRWWWATLSSYLLVILGLLLFIVVASQNPALRSPALGPTLISRPIFLSSPAMSPSEAQGAPISQETQQERPPR